MREKRKTTVASGDRPSGTHRPENTNFRIWPGVTVITVCASLVFIFVYVVAYRVHLIPLPSLLQNLLDTGGEKQVEAADIPAEGRMPAQETLTGTYYAPETVDPYEMLAAMQVPSVYHQRMRITYADAEKQMVDLYRQGDAWKLIVEDPSGTSLYQWNGAVLYRENARYPDGITTTAGSFTPENLLGLPTLTMVQSWAPSTVEMSTEDKVLRVRYAVATATDAEQEWVCRISLDASLVTEVQLYRNGEVVMAMYTEYFDLAPDPWEETAGPSIG